jgi:hypothetical protein
LPPEQILQPQVDVITWSQLEDKAASAAQPGLIHRSFE